MITPTATRIIQETARVLGVAGSDITSGSRYRYAVRARHMAMWVARRLRPAWSLVETGRNFGGYDHTTVMKGLARLEARMSDDAGLRAQADAVIAALPDLVLSPHRFDPVDAALVGMALADFRRGTASILTVSDRESSKRLLSEVGKAAWRACQLLDLPDAPCAWGGS